MMQIDPTQTAIFTQHEQAQADMAFASIKKAARWNPLFALWVGLLGALQLLVFVAEYELAFQVFAYVGGDGGYWSPGLMAVTGMLFIVAFHVMAHYKPGNPAVRLVTVLSIVMLPLYALGLGFLVMAILYGDGLADLVAVAQAFTLQVAEEALPQSWLAFFFEQLANPVSVLVFALATGGLAVVNLYISHHLIGAVTRGTATLYQRHVRYRDAKGDYAILQTHQRRFQAIAQARRTLATLTPVDIATEIAAEVLVTVQAGLAPHKHILKRSEYEEAPPRFLPAGVMPNPQQLAKDIARLDQVSRDDLFQAMNLSQPHTEAFES